MCISKKRAPSPTPAQQPPLPPPPSLAPPQPTSQRSKHEPSIEATQESEKYTSNEIKLKRILTERFLRRTVKMMPIGLRSEFGSMKRTIDFEKMKAFKKTEKLGKNRFKDNGCLDGSRVILGNPWPHDYINANYVSTPINQKRFICTQVPLEKTCADFWFMCLQEQVEVILMLCSEEEGESRYYEYYPTKKKDKLEFREGDQKIGVKLESAKRLELPRHCQPAVFEKVVTIEGPGGLTQKVTHYHFTQWRQGGVPPLDTTILELLNVVKATKTPIVIHGSAGIGRPGVVMMAQYAMDQYHSGQEIEDSDKILLKIREQRNNAVQKGGQYVFVHQLLLDYFRKTEKLFEGRDYKVVQWFDKEYRRCNFF